MELEQNQTPVILKFLPSTKKKLKINQWSPCYIISLPTALESPLNGSTQSCVESGRGCTLISDLMGPCGNVGIPGPSSLDSGGFADFADESQILFHEAQL